ncbi:MAG: hypothetical protein AAGB03_11370 [Pseudomonadota bacterium]
MMRTYNPNDPRLRFLAPEHFSSLMPDAMRQKSYDYAMDPAREDGDAPFGTVTWGAQELARRNTGPGQTIGGQTASGQPIGSHTIGAQTRQPTHFASLPNTGRPPGDQTMNTQGAGGYDPAAYDPARYIPSGYAPPGQTQPNPSQQSQAPVPANDQNPAAPGQAGTDEGSGRQNKKGETPTDVVAEGIIPLRNAADAARFIDPIERILQKAGIEPIERNANRILKTLSGFGFEFPIDDEAPIALSEPSLL